MLLYSFAYTKTLHTGTEDSYILVSEISFGLMDAVESINLGEQVPTIDKFGLTNTAFKFAIENTSDKKQQYTLRLIDKDVVSTIRNQEIRYQLTRNGIKEEIKDLPNSGIIDSGVINKGEIYEYSIVVWLGYEAKTTGGVWDKIIKVEAGNINIDASGANEPLLLENMIPIFFDNKEEVWKKADITNSNINYRWYDYADKVWANAITVKPDSSIDYFTATEGTKIEMDDIMMFYVWIPRFKYDLFGSGNPKLVNITFEQGIKNTGTLKCNISNGIENCTGEKESYTHPAFNFATDELTGFWINKFKIGEGMVSKPNQKILKTKNFDDLFRQIRSLELKDNNQRFKNSGTSLMYNGNISDDKNNYDLHLAKNFELAAVSYLTYSKYGKYDNPSYTGNNRHVFNNNSMEKTGLSYVNGNAYNYYVDYYGTGASTTGNIYGVYDLNGAVSEYTTALVGSDNGVLLDNKFDLKYLDIYTLYEARPFFRNVYGDAIDEFDGFTKEISIYPNKLNTHIVRPSITNAVKENSNDLYGGRVVLTVEQNIYIVKW